MADYQLTDSDEVIRTIDSATIPNDPENADRQQYEQWLTDGGVPDPYVVPDPPPPYSTPPVMVAAAYNILIGGGDAAVDGAFNIVGATVLDVGSYMLFFLEPQPDANYFAIITCDAPSKTMTEIATDYFILDVRDSGGIGFDPPSLSVEIMRTERSAQWES
jgi:hypothetical protein